MRALPAAAGLQTLGTSLGTVAAGLLVWLAISRALVPASAVPLRDLAVVQGLGLAAAAAGLALGGLAQWRTGERSSPWYRRAWLAWGLAISASLVLLAHNRWPAGDPGWASLCAAAACLSALAWIGANAMLEGGNPDSWVPVRLSLGLYGGLVLVLALVNWRWSGQMPASAALPPLLLMGVPAVALLVLAWRRELGPARGWPWEVLVLLAALPWLLVASSLLAPRLAPVAWPLASLAVLAGVVLERARPMPARRLPARA
jgi:hypothetical protein